MAKLIYAAITSLDGYIEDPDGNFDWVEPDAEVHTFINDLERPVGTYLYGRRCTRRWPAGIPTPRWSPGRSPRGTSLRSGGRPTRSCTRRRFRLPRPTGRESSETLIPRRSGARRDRREATSWWAVRVSPPMRSRPGWSTNTSCSSAPIVVGGGKQSLPAASRLELELLDQRRFGNGMVFLRYRTRT